MARARRARPARKRPNRQAGASRGLPGWAMLTIGLIIGLFVAFLVYLDDLDAPPSSAVERPGDQRTEDAPDEASPAAEKDSGEEAHGPRFEFYSILPELEVVVPDAGDSGPAPSETRTPEAAPPPDTESETASAPASEPAQDTTFYLQAGSFQQAEQADSMKARIALLGLDVAIQTVTISGERWHRVRVGPYSEKARLRSAQKRLRGKEIDFLVLREKSSG
jgi:cell division protein FtsN